MKKITTGIGGILGVLLIILGIITKAKESSTILSIGETDGPTAIFLAGQIGSGFSVAVIIVGVIVFGLSFLVWKKKSK